MQHKKVKMKPQLQIISIKTIITLTGKYESDPFEIVAAYLSPAWFNFRRGAIPYEASVASVAHL